MKIAYTLNSGNYGGMEWHVIYLAEGMVKKGYEVHVWCPDGPIVSEFEKVGAIVTKKSVKFDLDLNYIFELTKYLKSQKVNILHAHELKAVANSLIAGKLANVQVRISHTHTPISEWQTNKIKKWLTVKGYAIEVNLLATYEIALTPSRRDVKIKEGIKKEKLIIIKNPNAVKIADFAVSSTLKKAYRNEILQRHKIPENSLIWGYIGRISEEKGHGVLLDAFKQFYDRLDDDQKSIHKLLIAGGGPYEKDILGKVAQYNLSDNVVVTGRFSTEDRPKYFSTSDIFVHPSLAEGFGMVLVEAMVSGIPVLASDLLVFREVGGDSISYFKTNNAKDLAEKMNRIVNDPSKIYRLAKKAQERAERLFSFENFVDAYEQFYLEQMRY